ncbi:hypothetical protein BBF96_08160 [Anoxybacter fermentans]|uniref:Phosphoglycerate mutase n=1 Tax=Anoxybacter fermentans TaxID=1323375 RepID=A0A3S9SYM4_9FIRM|nr:histidine phosphatase family protein [Anoxybacter fermentans]AZR73358.1 hypothetical protein BBF96_08160 [Anoxybacter fermentans]
MLEIYLVRHGQTSWNAERRFQGQTDIPLSEKGIKQAKLVKDRLRYLKFDAIYSSDLKRAYETARIISEPHGIEVVSLAGLREINMGVWEGLTWDDIQRDYAEIHKIWIERPTLAKIPNFEGLANAARRAYKTFSEIALRHKDDQRILIVGHGLINATILCQIEGISLDDWSHMHQGNTAINIVEYDGKVFRVVLVNCTRHCEEE